MSTVRLEGLDELTARLTKIAEMSEEGAGLAARACCEYVKGVMLTQFTNGQAIGQVDHELGQEGAWPIRETRDPLGAVLGTNVPYARAQEYGCQKEVVIKTHFRRPTISRRPRESSRSFKRRRNVFQETKEGSTYSIEVRAHPRRMNLRPRRFLRGAVEASWSELPRIALGVWRRSLAG